MKKIVCIVTLLLGVFSFSLTSITTSAEETADQTQSSESVVLDPVLQSGFTKRLQGGIHGTDMGKPAKSKPLTAKEKVCLRGLGVEVGVAHCWVG